MQADRYRGFLFNPADLSEDVDLDLDRRREILYFVASMDGWTHWQVLGLPWNAPAEQARDAYREKVKLFHPDRYPGKRLGSLPGPAGADLPAPHRGPRRPRQTRTRARRTRAHRAPRGGRPGRGAPARERRAGPGAARPAGAATTPGLPRGPGPGAHRPGAPGHEGGALRRGGQRLPHGERHGPQRHRGARARRAGPAQGLRRRRRATCGRRPEPPRSSTTSTAPRCSPRALPRPSPASRATQVYVARLALERGALETARDRAEAVVRSAPSLATAHEVLGEVLAARAIPRARSGPWSGRWNWTTGLAGARERLKKLRWSFLR